MKKQVMKKVLIAAVILLGISIGFALLSALCEGEWRSAGIGLWLLTFLPSIVCFLVAGAFSLKDKKNNRIESRQNDENYKKIFPHMTTDENSSDDERELDDYLIMDMLDEDD